MYFYGYFQTYVLINYFIQPRWAEVSTWENFVLTKQDPGSFKNGSCLVGMELFACNHRMQFMKSL